MPYVYARNSAGFRFDEKQSHYVDCFLEICGAMLLDMYMPVLRRKLLSLRSGSGFHPKDAASTCKFYSTE
jgi:hypothetical protein